MRPSAAALSLAAPMQGGPGRTQRRGATPSPLLRPGDDGLLHVPSESLEMDTLSVAALVQVRNGRWGGVRLR